MSMAEPLIPHPADDEQGLQSPGSDIEQDEAQAAERPDDAELPVGELPDPPFRTPELGREGTAP